MNIELFTLYLGRYGYYGFDILNIDSMNSIGRSLFGITFCQPCFLFIRILYFNIQIEL